MLVLYPDYLVKKKNKQHQHKHQQNAVWEQDNFVLIIDLQLPLGVHDVVSTVLLLQKIYGKFLTAWGIISYDLDHYKPSLAAYRMNLTDYFGAL